MSGVKDGFSLVTEPVSSPAEQDNYKSATGNRSAVEAQIKTEILEGRYVIVDEKPLIVSALGAIEKLSGAVRLIHDASKPDNISLNDYAVLDEKKTFETIQDAEYMITEGCYLAKLDLKSAYRSVLVHPSQYPLTGLKWKFSGEGKYTYMIDTRLPFGARMSPGIFHELTQAVKHIMACKGYTGIVVYLDDFLVVEKTKEACIESLNTLIKLLRDLGFSISWDKVYGPTNKLTFLGIELDSTKMEMRLPEEKVAKFCSLIVDFCGRKRVSLRQCEKLAGKISWAVQVVRSGRVYLRRLFEAMSVLKAKHHKLKLSEELRQDILWWKFVLQNYNGVRVLQPEGPVNRAYVQTSPEGAGMQSRADWYYVNWRSDTCLAERGWVDKEVAIVAITVLNWAPKWRDSTVVICSKHKAAVNNFVRGTIANTAVRQLVGLALTWAAIFNVRLKLQVAEEWNFRVVECVAKLNEPGSLAMLESYIGFVPKETVQVACWILLSKMSLAAFYALFPQVEKWLTAKSNWLPRLNASS